MAVACRSKELKRNKISFRDLEVIFHLKRANGMDAYRVVKDRKLELRSAKIRAARAAAKAVKAAAKPVAVAAATA